MKKLIFICLVVFSLIGCSNVEKKSEDYNNYVKEKAANPTVLLDYEKNEFLDTALNNEYKTVVKWNKKDIIFYIRGEFQKSDFDMFKLKMLKESMVEIQEIMARYGYNLILKEFDNIRDTVDLNEFEKNVVLNISDSFLAQQRVTIATHITKHTNNPRTLEPDYLNPYKDEDTTTTAFFKKHGFFANSSEKNINYESDSYYNLINSIVDLENGKPYINVNRSRGNILTKVELLVGIPYKKTYEYTPKEIVFIHKLIKRQLLFALGLGKSNISDSIRNIYGINQSEDDKISLIDRVMLDILYNSKVESGMDREKVKNILK